MVAMMLLRGTNHDNEDQRDDPDNDDGDDNEDKHDESQRVVDDSNIKYCYSRFELLRMMVPLVQFRLKTINDD